MAVDHDGILTVRHHLSRVRCGAVSPMGAPCIPDESWACSDLIRPDTVRGIILPKVRVRRRICRELVDMHYLQRPIALGVMRRLGVTYLGAKSQPRCCRRAPRAQRRRIRNGRQSVRPSRNRSLRTAPCAPLPCNVRVRVGAHFATVCSLRWISHFNPRWNIRPLVEILSIIVLCVCQ